MSLQDDGLCRGRVCVVTGAGRGLGREHALSLARQGAHVVVNDRGVQTDGSGGDAGPAHEVVEEIVGFGGIAVANVDDISSWQGAANVVADAVDAFGRLDVVVNNAGILRDRAIANMTEEEWDSVIAVHLRGSFAVLRWAAAHWRDRFKAGEAVDGRVINTTSVTGLYGNAGQANYGAAKAGIASLTAIGAIELARYGVTVNAIAPAALTRMTETIGFGDDPAQQEAMDPAWVSPVVVWLASADSADVTGRVFEVCGRYFAIADSWHRGPVAPPVAHARDVGAVARSLVDLAKAPFDWEAAMSGVSDGSGVDLAGR